MAMTSFRIKGAIALATGLIAVLGVAACGSDKSTTTNAETTQPTQTTTMQTMQPATTTPATDARGKMIFVEKCGGCHVLAAAGTVGTAGNDLDKLKPDAATVAKQITDPEGTMPADLLTDKKEIDEVAKYVSSVAGKG